MANIGTNILANIDANIEKKISLFQMSLTYIAYFSRSIVIAAIGFATNIADLLRSGADDHSPLSGKRFFVIFSFVAST